MAGQSPAIPSSLKQSNPSQQIYLAIAQDVYQDFFKQPAIEIIYGLSETVLRGE